MAAGTEFSHPLSNVGSDYSDDSSEVSEVKDVISDNNEELKQTLNGKPPPHVSVVRHSLRTGAFLSPSELVSRTESFPVFYVDVRSVKLVLTLMC